MYVCVQYVIYFELALSPGYKCILLEFFNTETLAILIIINVNYHASISLICNTHLSNQSDLMLYVDHIFYSL